MPSRVFCWRVRPADLRPCPAGRRFSPCHAHKALHGRIMRCMGKPLAIDGLHILRRVYEASPEPESAEKAAAAIRHATASVRRLLETQAPTHVLPAFDADGDNWRHAIHPD